MPVLPRITVLPVLPTFHANPTRGATLLLSPWNERVHVPAHAQVERDAARDLPVVLREQRAHRVGEVQPGVAEALRELEGIRRRVAGVERERRAVRERVGAGEVVEEGDEAPRLDDVAAELPLVRAA